MIITKNPHLSIAFIKNSLELRDVFLMSMKHVCDFNSISGKLYTHVVDTWVESKGCS